MSLFKAQSTMLSLCSVAPNSPKTLYSSTTRLPLHTTAITRRRLLLFTLSISPSLTSLCSSSALETFDPVSTAERDASASLTRRVSEAVEMLERGRELQVQGDFVRALDSFSQVIKGCKDLALSEYARVGRALALYEVGDREEAIAELEDVSISLKGYPEVHAALAAALYADKHALLLAENQFTIATLLDPRYSDLTYVRETKHWPPSLIGEKEKKNSISSRVETYIVMDAWHSTKYDEKAFGKPALLLAASLHCTTRGAITEANEQLLSLIGSNESYRSEEASWV
ncbi:hypothetical protein Sjap_018433 [Stephania japonica]|uniref:Uncharacterized protein n=1 Tax=Stephania japonica TaxID=461633 RepID=A0AAP0I869_9MAGN